MLIPIQNGVSDSKCLPSPFKSRSVLVVKIYYVVKQNLYITYITIQKLKCFRLFVYLKKLESVSHTRHSIQKFCKNAHNEVLHVPKPKHNAFFNGVPVLEVV